MNKIELEDEEEIDLEEDDEERSINFNDDDIDTPVDELGLKFKYVQPDNRILKKLASRNLALGYIDSPEYKEIKYKTQIIMRYLALPKALGGWLTKEIALPIFKENELILILSNSLNGRLRQSLSTERVVNINEEVTRRKNSLNPFDKAFSRG